MRAVGYVRVSTEDQAREGFSLDAQRRAIRAYCEARGWKLGTIYADEGLSAYRDVRRPDYARMKADSGSWDVVVVWKLNRLHRTMRGFVNEALELRDSGKGLASVTEDINTKSAAGNLVFHIFAALSEFESAQTAERVRMAFREKIEGGKETWYTRAPLGYDNLHPKKRGGEGKLTVNDAEAETVREIFRLTIAGMGTHAVVRAMQRRRGKDGGHLHQVSCLQIVHNPVYAGYVYYDGQLRRNGHAPIVSADEFNAAQVALYVRTKKHHRYPLIVGPDRLDARRINTAGPHAQAVYIPKVRPPDLDVRVAREAARRAR